MVSILALISTPNLNSSLSLTSGILAIKGNMSFRTEQQDVYCSQRLISPRKCGAHSASVVLKISETCCSTQNDFCSCFRNMPELIVHLPFVLSLPIYSFNHGQMLCVFWKLKLITLALVNKLISEVMHAIWKQTIFMQYGNKQKWYLLIWMLKGLFTEREREMFYLTTHSTHFIYGYMASDIW